MNSLIYSICLLIDFKIRKNIYPVDIKGYLDKDTNTTKYSMIWEDKKLTSKKHTKWSAGCTVDKEDFEEKIKDCKDDNEKGELVTSELYRKNS